MISLTWEAINLDDLAGYKVYYDTDSTEPPYEGIEATEGKSPIDVGKVTSFKLSGLKPETKYYIAVTAYDTQGNEGWYGEVVEAETAAGEIKPPLPPELSLPDGDVIIQTYTPILKWSASEDATSYRIQIAKDSQFSDILIDKYEIKDVQYHVPSDNLSNLETYYWRVKAMNSVGESDWSEVSVFRVVTEFPRWDVNADGVVDISDLVIVGQHFGEDYLSIKAIAALDKIGEFSGKRANVSIDVQNKVAIQGVRMLRVDIKTDFVENLYGCQFDLKVLEVIGVKGGDVLAQDGASTYWNVSRIDNQRGKILDVTYVRKATKIGINSSGTLATVIFDVKNINPSGGTKLSLKDVKMVDADVRLFDVNTSIALLNWERLLVPEKSKLLQNYPNPFNPETWIPYQLSQDENVTISIYNVKGQLIRTLNIGNQIAGIYMTKERAAYWNSKDAVGESVSSSVYFYQLKAGGFSAIRKMVIVK